MKTKIHPKLYECEVSCRCGNKFTTRSTLKSLTLAICSECHPFYTGKSKFVDAAGQVDKFVKKFGWTENKVKAKASAKQVAGLTKRQIRAQVRKEKEAEALRNQRLDQAEAAARAEREEEEKQAQKQAETRKAASKAREKRPADS